MPGLEGTTLDHYQIQRRLGRGGMAEVYLAHDTETQQEVAIKILAGSQTAYLERFRREAEAIDKLHHEHILPAFDYGDEEPWHYLVMPYVPEGTLRDLMQKGPLALEDVADLLDQIASALQFAHDNGIIHRDIKPSNILLQDEHYIYLADFGLAKTVEGSSELTQTGVLLGTPEYMAPDLADGPATTSSDIYALGVLLYQMVAGRVPFVAETPVAVYWKQIREQPEPPSHLNPELTPAIDRVILHALEKDPRKRFQSALELATAYRQALQEPSFPASPPLQEPPRRVRQKLENLPIPSPSTPSTPPHISPHRLVRNARRMRGSQKKLILSDDPLATPTGVRVKRKRVQLNEAGALPPLPLRQPEPVEVQKPAVVPEPVSRPSGTQYHPPAPKQTRKLNGLTISIVGVGLLLFIVLPMSYLYYTYRTQGSRAASIANAANGQATQQPTRQPTQQDPTTRAMAAQNTVLNSKPLLVDNLSSDNANRWTVDGTHCTFNTGGYYVTVPQPDYLQYCPLLQPSVNNTAAQVDVTLLTSNSAGMLFRLSGDQFYDFEITNQNQFFFRRHDVGATSNAYYFYLIKNTHSNAILPADQKNTLFIIANGNDFKLYINGSFVGEAQDSNYSSGQLALAAGTPDSIPTAQAKFTNFKLFQAPA
ncbi:MAG: protein kinase [Chloroflexota bacterium]|nr:protein kinase [Chloroflexota bacterium]